MPKKSKGPRLVQRPTRAQWFIRYIDPTTGRQRDQSTGSTDRREAELKLAEFLLQQSEPRNMRMRREGMLIAEAISRYALFQEKRGRAERLKYSMKHLLPFWGERNVYEIDQETLLDYELANRFRGSGTIRREMVDLRSATNFVAKKGFIQPIAFPQLPPDSEPKERWLTEAEFAHLLNCARQVSKARYNLLTFLMVAFYTGARKGAIMDMEWNQVDFEANGIRFLKTGDRQTNKRKGLTGMPFQLLAHLKQRFRKYGHRSEFVFHRSCRPHCRVKSIDKSFRKAVEIAQLDDVTPHTLRHTRASLLVQGGVSMDEASMVLDISIDTLKRVYAHFDREQLSEKARYMGRQATMRSQNVRITDRAKRRIPKKTKNHTGASEE